MQPGMSLNPNQADALLAGGHITGDQYDQLVGATQPPAPLPQAAPPVAPPVVDESPVIPPVSDALGSPMFNFSNKPPAEDDPIARAVAYSEQKDKDAKLEKYKELEANVMALTGGNLSPEQQKKLAEKRRELVGEEADEGLADVTKEGATPSVELATDVNFTGDPTKDVPQQQPWDMMGQGSPMFQGLDMQQAAVMQAANAAEQKAAAEGAALRETVQQQKLLAQEQEQQRIKEQQRLDDATTEINTATAELANTKIDPGRHWANMETPNKIMAAIGLIMGSFGNKGNQAAEMLQKIIDRDVKAQMADIDTQKGALNSKQNAYQMMRGRFGDNDIARKAATAAGWEAAEVRLKEIATKFEGQEAGASALNALGQIQEKKDQLKREVVRQWAAKQALADGDTSMMKKEDRERYVPGYGLANSAADATKIKDKVAAVNTSKDGIRELLALSGKTGKSLSLEDRAKAQTIGNMLIGSLRVEIVGPGAMSESEIAIMKNIIRDPTSITSLDSSNKAALETLMKRLDSSMKSELKARGLSSQQDQLGITPRER